MTAAGVFAELGLRWKTNSPSTATGSPRSCGECFNTQTRHHDQRAVSIEARCVALHCKTLTAHLEALVRVEHADLVVAGLLIARKIEVAGNIREGRCDGFEQ